MKRTSLFITASAFGLLSVFSTAFAQDEKSKKDKEDDKPKTIEAFVEDFDKMDGLFPVYTDPETGALYMEFDAGDFGQEYIYHVYTENGSPQIGLFRGSFRDNRIVSINKRYNKIEISAENTSFTFDEDSALKRAEDANITRAPLAVSKIVAQSGAGKNERFLIDFGAVVSSETLNQITPWVSPASKPGQQFSLGKLSKEKTRITKARNYPENTDVIVEYVFDNPQPKNYGNPSITDARAVAVTMQHTFLALPEDEFKPRNDDFRVGFFTDQSTNLTSDSYTPYADVINRWNLVKKNPDADMSDPVEPITWWIENTTPVELRELITSAALEWNTAFEAAGISNALEVKVQPDDADWDAGDIRYNVLRWTSSPTPPFGGYGPSFTNPRTGQILGADIMLEYVFLTNRLRSSQIFEEAALPATFETPAFESPVLPHLSEQFCQAGAHLQHQMMAGAAVLQAQGATDVEVGEMLEDGLRYLIIHEIGHTLGLTHNMRASSTIPLEDLPATRTVAGSIMDYPALNIAADGQTQGAYSLETPGPYDIWAIAYGYTPSEQEADALLARSTEPALAYGNDADDMRAPGRHIDPRVMIGDLSDDPVGWARQRIDLVDAALEKLPDSFEKNGDTYDALRTSYLILTGQRATALNITSRQIGGVYNNRALIGQDGAGTPFEPVPLATQKAALRLLADELFAPDAFETGEDIANRLQAKRRGFTHGAFNEDPKLHSRALGVQRNVFNHIMHPSVLTRMTDARRYGGNYPVATYLKDLTNAVFNGDPGGNVNTYRQNLQIEYVNRLLRVAKGQGVPSRPTPGGASAPVNYDSVARSAALSSLMSIKKNLIRPRGNAETRAHQEHILFLIKKFEES